MFLRLDPLTQSELWWFSAGVVIALLIALFVLFYQLRVYRLITGTPTSQLRSAAQGFVELEGYCVGNAYPLTSPYSGRPCVWYECKTYKKVKRKKGHSWKQIDRQTSPHWFKVADPTGEAWVDPKGASVQTQISKTWHGSTSSPRSDSGLLFGSNYRFKEELLIADSPFYGLGRLRTVNPEQLRAMQVRDWVKQKRKSGPDVELIDDKGEGNSLFFGDQPTLNLLHKPLRWGYPFILSGTSQERTARSIKWNVILALLACAALTWFLVELQYAPLR